MDKTLEFYTIRPGESDNKTALTVMARSGANAQTRGIFYSKLRRVRTYVLQT